MSFADTFREDCSIRCEGEVTLVVAQLHAGVRLAHAVRDAITFARSHAVEVMFEHNATQVRVSADSDAGIVLNKYDCDRMRK